ncbi:MAG: DNA mismatch repair protein MutS [Hyphomicrobiales bacterium]|nr:DNA mismatch repair protein MutS [Hyphomicrobiales bacterium]
MMAQYLEIKAANPDCLLFYRMGDFYELFFEDAEVASRALGIVLTRRGKHQGEDIAMCGVPVDRADDYLQRLIALGHRVAVCEQLEDPAEARKRGSKSVVRRDVVRLVTPGTITEERLLEPGRAHLLVATARVRGSDETWLYGVAAVDISTGAFSVCECEEQALAAELARLEPREIAAGEALVNDATAGRILRECGAPLAPVGRLVGDAASAERRLCDFFGIATIDGFGGLTRAEAAAAATAVLYIERTQLGARPALVPPRRQMRGGALEIDAATRANLELTRTLSGAREGALIAAIDRTTTPAGARLLAERLAGPLTDAEAINARLDAVAFLADDETLRSRLRGAMQRAPDMARALSRLSLGRGGPRDLNALGAGASAARALADELARATAAPPELARLAPDLAGVEPALANELAAALAETLPLDRRDGGFIAQGFDASLDETRALRDESRRLAAALQTKYADLAETKQIKIKHNNFLGFFLETTQQQGEKLLKPPYNATFIHRQTMAGAMRFSTSELAEFESRIASAADRALALELAHFDRLCAAALAQSEAIKRAADALAALDVCAGLADLADTQGWTRPIVDASLAFVIEGGRHPVVEAALKAKGDAFTPNDCDLSGDAAGAVAVVTGPNMAGKSTFLRQNALAVALAQMGSFVPARRAHIGVVDRLFSRVGASDDLARGRSTFMVEMVETAAILNQASARSLVILDEIGRGTATFDGLSIAWAAMEHLHDANKSRALFATHFHELTQLQQKLPRLKNLTMRVSDWNGEVVFLHEVTAGAADRSYGVQVAKLAGLPETVVNRARQLLSELESSDRRAPVERMIADLPLFAAPPAPAPKADGLRDRLEEIEPDEMSPREALQALYDLKKMARREKPGA